MLVHPIVIGEDCARADIGLHANGGVTHVAEMRHLAALADFRVLRLDEGANFTVSAERGAGAQVRERADGCPSPDHRERRVSALHDRVLADLAIEESRVGADRRAGFDDRRTPDLRARQERDIRRQLRLEVDPGGCWVLNGHPGQLPAAHDERVELLRGFAELRAIIDSGDEPRIGNGNRGHFGAGQAEQSNHVGEVLLAL